MTTLTATSAMIEGLGRPAATATNPRYNPAFLSGDGILGWFGRTDFLRSLIARKADRDLKRAMQRLSKTSPHLLADVCGAASTVPADPMPRPVRSAVAPRPAQRTDIAARRRAPVAALSMLPARAAEKEQPVAQ